MSSRQSSTNDEHECQQKGLKLRDGERVLFNDRSRPLTVQDRHKRQNSTSTWKRRGIGKYHTVIELEGNATEYHLLCTPGSSHGPMLYKESDWDEEKTDDIGQSPVYSRAGERVESLDVVSE